MKRVFLLIVALILLVGCKGTVKLDKNHTTDEMVPEINLDGYVTVPVDEVVEKVGYVASAAGMTIPEPTTRALSGITSFVGCMQGKGAWSSKAYYYQGELSFGLAASASKKESIDAMNLFECSVRSFFLSRRLLQVTGLGKFEPQLCRWEAETPNDRLYNIVIVSHKGMMDKICEEIPGGCHGCQVIS